MVRKEPEWIPSEEQQIEPLSPEIVQTILWLQDARFNDMGRINFQQKKEETQIPIETDEPVDPIEQLRDWLIATQVPMNRALEQPEQLDLEEQKLKLEQLKCKLWQFKNTPADSNLLRFNLLLHQCRHQPIVSESIIRYVEELDRLMSNDSITQPDRFLLGLYDELFAIVLTLQPNLVNQSQPDQRIKDFSSKIMAFKNDSDNEYMDSFKLAHNYQEQLVQWRIDQVPAIMLDEMVSKVDQQVTLIIRLRQWMAQKNVDWPTHVPIQESELDIQRKKANLNHFVSNILSFQTETHNNQDYNRLNDLVVICRGQDITVNNYSENKELDELLDTTTIENVRNNAETLEEQLFQSLLVLLPVLARDPPNIRAINWSDFIMGAKGALDQILATVDKDFDPIGRLQLWLEKVNVPVNDVQEQPILNLEQLEERMAELEVDFDSLTDRLREDTDYCRLRQLIEECNFELIINESILPQVYEVSELITRNSIVEIRIEIQDIYSALLELAKELNKILCANLPNRDQDAEKLLASDIMFMKKNLGYIAEALTLASTYKNQFDSFDRNIIVRQNQLNSLYRLKILLDLHDMPWPTPGQQINVGIAEEKAKLSQITGNIIEFHNRAVDDPDLSTLYDLVRLLKQGELIGPNNLLDYYKLADLILSDHVKDWGKRAQEFEKQLFRTIYFLLPFVATNPNNPESEQLAYTIIHATNLLDYVLVDVISGANHFMDQLRRLDENQLKELEDEIDLDIEKGPVNQ